MSHNIVKEAVRCGHNGCGAIVEPEERAYFCDYCGSQTSAHLRLKRFKSDVDKTYTHDDVEDYDFCSWRCLFKKVMTLKHVDFLSLPLVTSNRERPSQLAALRRFLKPLLDAEDIRIG